MPVTFVEEPYPENLFDVPRFMCPQCGLIFDNLSDYGPGSYGEHEWEDDWEIFCPRCKYSFAENFPIPIVVQKFDSSDPPETTFFVEDRVHKLVVEQIAQVRGKRVVIHPLGKASYVEHLFRVSISQGGWVHGYFMVDGDDKIAKNPSDPHFIRLDRYCMESYLLDVEICAKISGGCVSNELGGRSLAPCGRVFAAHNGHKALGYN